MGQGLVGGLGFGLGFAKGHQDARVATKWGHAHSERTHTWRVGHVQAKLEART